MLSKFTNFIKELNVTNSSNDKLKTLTKYKEDEDIKNLLKYTYSNKFNYGVSKDRVFKNSFQGTSNLTLFQLLDSLNEKKLVGNRSLEECCCFKNTLNSEDQNTFLNILGRDLKCNINVKQINKVFKNLIEKPNYMRCDVFSTKSSKNIKFPAYIQVKMDGTYREFRVQDGNVQARTRSGEEYFNPVLFEQLSKYPNGFYVGELTIHGDSRFTGNGLINSDNPPYDKIMFTMWDYLTFDDYNLVTKTKYYDRFEELNKIFNQNLGNNLAIVKTEFVHNISEALHYVKIWMQNGLEGGVLKSLDNEFKNGTSKTQLKIKLKIDTEMRITGFTEGSRDTKREGYIGAIQFQNDEGTIKGQCSGFTEEQMKQFTKEKDNLIGKIISVEFNDLGKAVNSETYSLTHPVFIEIRNDKEETDTLEKVLKLREMAMEIK